MIKSCGMMTAVLALSAGQVWAQPTATTAGDETKATVAPDTAEPNGAPSSTGEAPAASGEMTNTGDIIVTATRRASRLSDVPIAVSAISAETLRNTGATDIRQLTQVAPSLLVSSTSSEAGGGGARIRGVGTVGDNPGLESSVATFIDGVYRSRAGVALTELGPVERVEVLRGPQGTLFGRNASAGLISITSANPKDVFGGYAEGSYGNYDAYRIAAGITGPIGQSGIDYRLDGVYNHRDGFLKDVISGRRVNGRDRYLLRGKLRYEPTDALSVLLIGDYSRQNEECCAATFLPAVDRTRQADGTFLVTPSSIAALERSFTSVVPGAGNGITRDDTFNRRVAITPGRSARSDVEDWGGSGQIDLDLGTVKLTSITAYRSNLYTSGQDSDFNNLDILVRPDDGSRFNRFRTFTQEVRAQGSLFGDKLDWLVGGYYAHEKLTVTDNLTYGADYDRYATLIGASGLSAASPALGQLFAATGFGRLNAFASGFANSQLAALPAAQRTAVAGAIAAQVQNTALSGTSDRDRFDQSDRNFALFTHNIIHFTDKLSLTIGARHTWDRKTLDASLSSNSPCGTYNANIARLQALAASGALGGASAVASGLANQVLAPLAGLTCVVNSVNGEFSGKRKEREWTGTTVLSYKPTDRIMVYASASRGYKAGGFNLDRAPLYNPVTRGTAAADNLNVLQFSPEKVDAFEVGTKIRGRGFDINVAGFYQRYKSFQLNTFNGTAFFVTDIRGCKDDLGTTDSDAVAGNSACGNSKSGVTSKGVEVEAFLYPARNFNVSTGFTYADTRYGKDLTGTADLAGNNSLPPALSLLPAGRLSLSNLYTVTGSAQWTPPVGSLRGLLYGDFRYTSELNTGSDLFSEKAETGVMIVNARIGIGAQDGNWSLEGWVRNAFDVDYIQTAFNATLQGSNTSAGQLTAGQRTTQLFGAFLAEPRTFGVSARKTF
jgi:outer membrane receptor protein involved in Fe transport